MNNDYSVNPLQDFIYRLRLRFYIGRRYISFRKSNGKKNIIFFTLFAGISGGLLVLTVVLSIMNGFQNNHISRRIEIGSYHVIIKKKNNRVFTAEEAGELKKSIADSFPEVEAIVPYADREIIMYRKRRRFSEKQVVKLRAVDPAGLLDDSKFLSFFSIMSGPPRQFEADYFEEVLLARLDKPEDKKKMKSLYDYSESQGRYILKDLQNESAQAALYKILKKTGFHFGLDNYTILVGNEMAMRLIARPDDILYLTSDISLRSSKAEGIPFVIKGTYATGSYLYDRYWAYISLESLGLLTGKVYADAVGVKFVPRTDKKAAAAAMKEVLGSEYEIQTAEELNRGYFSALKLEKVMIMLLFFMIFTLVAANTFGALKLTVLEKKSDILVLKAIGLSPNDVQLIFIIESILLGFGGSFTGLILGIFVAFNISNIFFMVENIVNGFLNYIVFLLQFARPGIHFDPVKIYDHTIYYQSGFLVKLYLHELIIISLLIIVMTIVAAYIPVLRASRVRPNELLRNPNL